QALEGVGVPEGGIDAAEVADVIAVIMAGGGEEGGDPDSVHVERLDVVQSLDDSLQVAHAVSVRVGEGADVDLVDDGVGPPHVVNRPAERMLCHMRAFCVHSILLWPGCSVVATGRTVTVRSHHMSWRPSCTSREGVVAR